MYLVDTVKVNCNYMLRKVQKIFYLLTDCINVNKDTSSMEEKNKHASLDLYIHVGKLMIVNVF